MSLHFPFLVTWERLPALENIDPEQDQRQLFSDICSSLAEWTDARVHLEGTVWKNGHVNKVLALLKRIDPDLEKSYDRLQLHLTQLLEQRREGEATLLFKAMDQIVCPIAFHAVSTAYKLGLRAFIVQLIASRAHLQTQDTVSKKTQMHLASEYGMVDLLERLVQTSVCSVCVVDSLGNSPLHVAARKGSLAMAKLLIQNGDGQRFVNEPNQAGLSPLFLLCGQRKTALLTFLVEQGENLFQKRRIGQREYTPFLWACQQNDLPVATKIFHLTGRDRRDIPEAYKIACQLGNQEIVEWLLSQDPTNLTNEAVIAAMAHEGLAEKLLEAEGPKLDWRELLHAACKNGSSDAVLSKIIGKIEPANLTLAELNSLIEAGRIHLADSEKCMPRFNSDKLKRELVFKLARYGSSVWMRPLLQTRRELVNERDETRNTPLHLASQWGHFRVVKAILEVPGADLHAKDVEGNTPFCLAAQFGQREVMESYPAEKLTSQEKIKIFKMFAYKNKLSESAAFFLLTLLQWEDLKRWMQERSIYEGAGWSPFQTKLLQLLNYTCSQEEKASEAVKIEGIKKLFYLLQEITPQGKKVHFLETTPLHITASNGQYRLLQELIHNLKLANLLSEALLVKNERDQYPLQLALEKKNDACALLLLKEGADPQTAVMIAQERDFEPVLRHLLAVPRVPPAVSSLLPTTGTISGSRVIRQQLVSSAENRKVEDVILFSKTLKSLEPSIKLPSLPTSSGQTLLELSVDQEEFALTDFWIEQGGSIEGLPTCLQEKYGWYLQSQGKQPKGPVRAKFSTLHRLLKQGEVQTALTHARLQPSLLGATDERGRNPFHIACERGHSPFIQAYLKNPLFFTPDALLRTPLHYAALSGKNFLPDFIQFCLPSYHLPDYKGRTPWMLANFNRSPIRAEMAKRIAFRDFLFFASPEELIEKLLAAIETPEFCQELHYFWEATQKSWREFIAIVETIDHWKEFVIPFKIPPVDQVNPDVAICLVRLHLIEDKV